MDFPIATRIPSFENSFSNYLSDSIITVNVNHRQPTQAIFSHCCSTPSPEATKSRERPVTYMYIQEPTDNVRSSFKITWTFGDKSVSVSIRNWILNVLTNCKLQRIHFASLLSTSCGRSFGYGLFSWNLYYTSFTLINWHLKVTGKWPFLMFMGSLWNYLISILQ
jgi:hypothetical protein